jgi:hypothetical protein
MVRFLCLVIRDLLFGTVFTMHRTFVDMAVRSCTRHWRPILTYPDNTLHSIARNLLLELFLLRIQISWVWEFGLWNWALTECFSTDHTGHFINLWLETNLWKFSLDTLIFSLTSVETCSLC